MGITAGDIDYELTGGAGETQPDDSLGGGKSGTSITSATDNNVFDDVTGAEASAGDTEYRAIAVINEDATEDWTSVVLWITSETGSPSTAIDLAGETPAGDSIQTIADESTAPTGVSFTHPTTKGAGIDMTGQAEATGTLAAAGGVGSWCGIWLRRVVSSGATGYSADSCTIRCEGETVGCPPGEPPGRYLVWVDYRIDIATGLATRIGGGYEPIEVFPEAV